MFVLISPFNVTNQGTPLALGLFGSNVPAAITRSYPRTLRLVLRWTR
jgi:hypothetical protein